jgi:hypothetical protein
MSSRSADIAEHMGVCVCGRASVGEEGLRRACHGEPSGGTSEPYRRRSGGREEGPSGRVRRRTGAGIGAEGGTFPGGGLRVHPEGRASARAGGGRCIAAPAVPCGCPAAEPGPRRWACPPPCARSSR